MTQKLKTQLVTTLGALTISATLAAAPLLQLGNGLSVHALASMELSYEDNIFLTNSNKENDLILDITPGIELRMAREGAASVTLKYEHIFRFYNDFSDLDRDLANLTLGVRYDSGVVLANFSGSFRQFSTNDSTVVTGDRLTDRDVTRIGGDAKYGISRLLAVRVGASYDKTEYKDDRFTDTEGFSVPVTLFYQVRPKVDLTAGIRYREVDAINPTAGREDYRDVFYSVGVVGELFSPVIIGEVKVGIQDRKYKTSGFSIDTPSYEATVTYVGDPKLSVSLGLRRDYRVSALNTGSYVSTIATLSTQYSLTRQWALSGAISFGNNDYRQSLRDEDLFFLNLGATYRPNDFIAVNVGYEYQDISGNLGFNSYKLNRFRVAASLRY